MLRKEVLEELLACPLTGSPLQWLEEEGLLKARDHEIYYPVLEDIVLLLPRYALMKDQQVSLDPVKKSVQAFYDEIGWKAEAGVFRNARDSEDLRPVSQEYIQHCHERIQNHLPASGRYLLDVACGPIQYPAYMQYSERFEYRICADLSLTALKEAKTKLKAKGIYLLCDITQLPIQNNVVDAVISLHTLYHVPADQQKKGFAELYRVLKSGGQAVIVYSWGVHSLLMNGLMFPFKVANRIRGIFLPKQPTLYFYTHSYRWFCEELREPYHMQLKVWRSVNVPFLKVFIHSFLGGRYLLKIITRLEEMFPRLMGHIGAYPLLISTKQ